MEYLNKHELHRHRYEVISKGSRYFGSLDFINSAHPLKAGHHYEVSFNRNPADPLILNVVQELM